MALTQVQPGMLGTPQPYNFKNRIINGAMVIDQRNAGASVTQTTANLYTVDRFYVTGNVTTKFTAQQNAGSVTPPVGFTNYLGITSSSSYSTAAGDYFFLAQPIEGFNTADLQWGTANAKTVTLSFQVYSSLTGTFGGSLRNSAGNRSYPFSYTVSNANTWTSVSVNIAGDTTGTWVGATNGIGIECLFSMGIGTTYAGTTGAWVGSNKMGVTGQVNIVGTSGAKFYVTGVQLEVGVNATGFDYRPYGTELALCQRYYWKLLSPDGSTRFGQGLNISTTQGRTIVNYPVPMRAPPTAIEQSGTASDYRMNYGSGTSTNLSSVLTFDTSNVYLGTVTPTVASGLTGGGYHQLMANNTSAYLAWSAEL